MSVTSTRRSRCKPSERHQPVKVLLHLVPAGPLLALLIAVLVRDANYEPPAPPVTVIVQQHPEQKTRATHQAPPVFKVSVQEEPPEFDQTFAAPRPVTVTIVDEKEERTPVPPQPVTVEIKDFGPSGLVPAMSADFAAVDPRPRVIWHYGAGMRFGIGAVETRKRLTFSPDGETNQTLLRVNGQIGEFGGPLGRFVERDARWPPDPARDVYATSRSTWLSDKMIYTQILELLPSKQPIMIDGRSTRLLDTIRVRYLIENKDVRPMTAGLRMQLDTLIGANDGVPFTVPGLRGLVTYFADFPKLAPIPDFIQALERPSLRDPGTVAHLGLKLGGQTEPPSRVTLTHWPGVNFPNWEVPLAPLNGDSAVVLYWNDKPLKPGEKREMGFAYGLGSVASSDPGGTLGITLGGSFEPGEAFTVTAYVQGHKKGQTLALDVPPGLERLEGNETQTVPAPVERAKTSIVTWKVKVLRTGTFPLKVVSNTGLSQAKTISIGRPEATPELRLTVDLSGSFQPGQEFIVHAKLASTGPVPPSTPGLTLSTGLTAGEVPTLKAQVAAADDKGHASVASWKVKVREPGTTVRVDWSGAAITKTLNISRPPTPTGGYCTMTLSGPYEPGKAFTVAATVSDPILGQTLKLQLPAGLHFAAGQEEMPVVRTLDGPVVIKWQVMVDQVGTFPLQLISSAGLTLKKTITIERGDDKGGSFKLDYLGQIAPGNEITVRAKVTNPVPGQQLTLLPLPAGLERVDDSASRTVPPVGNQSDKSSVVTWRVRVLDQGTLPVRVASTTGVVQSFTITIRVEQTTAGGQPLFGGR